MKKKPDGGASFMRSLRRISATARHLSIVARQTQTEEESLAQVAMHIGVPGGLAGDSSALW